MRPFNRVLVANRGEIALRIVRACRDLGLESVAIHSTADRDLPHVGMADAALAIGPPPSSQSYLDIDAILLAAQLTGAEAVHPGYGFLSENAEFAQAVTEAGLVFIGPSADAMRKLGDKVAAKSVMQKAHVPCVPGSPDALPADGAAILEMAAAVGYPVIVKAAAGGGGRGMRVVREPAELLDAVSVTREEAKRAFGSAAVYLERFIERPRHVELQILADGYGGVAVLGERDCSMQRRHQKIIEEGPAPGVSRAALTELGEACQAACRSIGYVGAGTFEFLYEAGQFFFIEMNTRVQVEHPVTEMIAGVDIVAAQIEVAMGRRLPAALTAGAARGHAIECRINAEDPVTFRPSTGAVTVWEAPSGPGIRVDTHMRAGMTVSPYYDSLLAKVIAHGADRGQALARMRRALREFRIEGVKTNLPLHRALLAEPGFVAGAVDIRHLETLVANPNWSLAHVH